MVSQEAKSKLEEAIQNVTWLEPTTNEWERLTTVGGSLKYAIQEITDEVSHWEE